jgi:hypothetical protein
MLYVVWDRMVAKQELRLMRRTGIASKKITLGEIWWNWGTKSHESKK